ncbi:YidH family protein [Caldalkalibacillus mannanilyticus]|uniref:YidH family protein n=1 Tax=Caldalkalibacillus mannanilyticus TaxID=1418 RepID=UPI00046AC96E|nr:DUF202 domain-containing protein [Caldalkalibacillus mannanilyticus]
MENPATKTLDSKYIQQHLANERTYLAWIRTALAFIGIGFLVSNLHFATPSLRFETTALFFKLIGGSSVLLGIFTIIFATVSYVQKRKNINSQTFRSPKNFIFFFSLLSILITLLFGVYFLVFF